MELILHIFNINMQVSSDYPSEERDAERKQNTELSSRFYSL